MNANQIHKLKLEEFWDQFGGKKTDGAGFKTADKLEALKKMSVFVVPFKRQASIQERRTSFDESKAVLHKLWLRRNSVCFCCGLPATARHHIIQIQNGGLNCRKNVVSLCDECHAEIHPWLGNARTSQLTGQQEKENVRALNAGNDCLQTVTMPNRKRRIEKESEQTEIGLCLPYFVSIQSLAVFLLLSLL